MESQNSNEILHDFSPRFLVYKDGRVQRLREDIVVPPSYDPKTRVHSKDVDISPGVSARVYRPDNIPENAKLPLLIYYHGGAYCQYRASSLMYHTYLNSLVSEANVIAVSADYRLAPEYPMPICYDDNWAVTRWALSHSIGSGPDQWLAQWADMGRVFLGGDSAGANFSHDMVVRAGKAGLLGPDTTMEGVVMVHPYFATGDQPDELIVFLSEGKMEMTDPRLSPTVDPARMRREIGCKRLLVCVDKDDFIKERGVMYYEALINSGWEGNVELIEINGGGHVFHLFQPHLPEAHELLKLVASFINKSI